MAGRAPPDFGPSFLDLLCSGMGGVALLVVLFAAMQTLQERRATRLTARVLIVEISGGPASFRMGREVSVSIAHPTEGSSALHEPPASSDSKFRVTWPEPGPPIKQVAAVVTCDAAEELSVRGWLQSLAVPAGVDPLAHVLDVEKVVVERQAADVTELKVYWQDQKDAAQTIRLQKADQHQAECKVIYEQL